MASDKTAVTAKRSTFPLWNELLTMLLRLVVGATFAFSGFVKAIDPWGTIFKVDDYLAAMQIALPDSIVFCGVFALFTIEFLLGVCFILGAYRRLAPSLAMLMMLVMLPLTLWIAVEDPVSDCGCFGDALVISHWQTFWKNVVLITLAIVLVLLRKSVNPLWRGYMEVIIAFIAASITFAFMEYTYRHLPMVDFRPYKIGNHLPTLMEYPENAEPDQYEFSFVYEKDGVEETFTLENYPKGDSTWTFVRQESKLIKKGYEPPIHDFEIINAEGEDLTWTILESEDLVTLIVMYDLAKADKKQMDKIEALYANCQLSNVNCYILTGSGTDEIIAFSMEHPTLSDCICTCDPVTLKTIVRANPGAIVLQNGTVIDKYNLRNRP